MQWIPEGRGGNIRARERNVQTIRDKISYKDALDHRGPQPILSVAIHGV